MKVKVIYTAQLKHTLGRAYEDVELADSANVGELLEQLVQTHGDSFNKLFLASPGKLQTAILICIGGECLGSDLSTALKDGDELTFLSPVSGG